MNNQNQQQDIDIYQTIGEFYLFTVHDKEYVQYLENQLAKAGIQGFKRKLLNYFAAGGLWWNLNPVEFDELGFRDIIFGWIIVILLYLIIGVVIYIFFGFYIATLVALLVHFFILVMGYAVPKQTIPNQ